MKKVPPKPRPSSWLSADEMTANGRTVYRGDEVTVRDHSGRKLRVRFYEMVYAPRETWFTAHEVDKSTGKGSAWRSFAPDRILTVHRTKKLDPRRKK